MMEKQFIHSIGDDNDKFIKEGIKDYIEDQNIDEPDVDTIFDSSYAGVYKIFDLLSRDNIRHNYEFYNHLESELNRIIIEKIYEKDFLEVINFGKKLLLDFVQFAEVNELDISKPGDNILITEAVNWAAKIKSGVLYMIKPAMILASAKNGARIGVANDSGWPVYYLFDREVGVSSFHDPNDEVQNLLDLLEENIVIPQWEFGWSGIYRQDMAFELISHKERLFLQKMRYRTLPGKNAKHKKELFDWIDEKYSI